MGSVVLKLWLLKYVQLQSPPPPPPFHQWFGDSFSCHSILWCSKSLERDLSFNTEAHRCHNCTSNSILSECACARSRHMLFISSAPYSLPFCTPPFKTCPVKLHIPPHHLRPPWTSPLRRSWSIMSPPTKCSAKHFYWLTRYTGRLSYNLWPPSVTCVFNSVFLFQLNTLADQNEEMMKLKRAGPWGMST